MNAHVNLVDVIAEYTFQSEEFEKLDHDAFAAGDADAIAETFMPPLKVLRAWDRPAKNLKEALAALNLAAFFKDQFDGEPAIESLERAANRYLSRLN